MDQEQAKQLGIMLRQQRKKLGFTSTEVARLTGINQSSVVRLERGRFGSTDPDKLRAMAEVLELNLADLLALADYPIPADLPSPGPYLRAKYRDLTPTQLEALQRDVAHLLRQHGLDPSDGPAPGEDETNDPKAPTTTTATKKSVTARAQTKKGGNNE